MGVVKAPADNQAHGEGIHRRRTKAIKYREELALRRTNFKDTITHPKAYIYGEKQQLLVTPPHVIAGLVWAGWTPDILVAL